MTSPSIILLTVAAFMHVAWNLGGQVSGPTPKFFRIAIGYTSIVLAPLMIYALPALLATTPSIWLLLVMSGLFQCIYFSGLSRAYISGHLSVAYPLTRSWPALIVVFISILRGNGNSITWMVVGGIILILLGSISLPLTSLRELRISTYTNASCAFALLAAVGTAGYTISDDVALRTLNLDNEFPNWILALIWLGYESLSAVTWLWVFERFKFLQASADTPAKISRWRTVLVAMVMGGTYALVLISYGMVDDVSYVAGFRQLSVPIGTIAGVVILREPGPPLKFLGVSLMFFGLILVALG